jgi:MSHA biogenesis protein MshQ
MCERGTIAIPKALGAVVLLAAIAVCAPVQAQHAPALTGSRSASSAGAAVSSLAITAPAALFPGNVMIANVSQSYGSRPTQVNLSSAANLDDITTDGTTGAGLGVCCGPAGYTYSSNAFGTSQITWNGQLFTLLAANGNNTVTNATIPLPAGRYAGLSFLASTVYGPVTNQVFTVTYSDGSTTNFTLNMSDWGAPQSYTGESIAATTAYRDYSGTTQTGPWYLYGYTLTLNSAKTISSLTMPANTKVGLFAINLTDSSFVASNAGASAPAGWTQATETSANGISQAVYYKIATSADVAGTTSYTFTFPTSAVAAASIMDFQGVSTTTPIAASAAQANAASTSYTAPAATNVATETWVGLYTIGNGTTSGSDFNTPYSGNATKVIDAGSGSGTSGALQGGFYFAGCSPSCNAGTWVATSTASISAPSIGTSLLLLGATPAPSMLWHMDESAWSGTTGEVADSSGNGYNGTAAGGATTAGTSPALSGSSGTCYYGSFSGVAQYVQVPSAPHINSNSTVTAWIRPTANTASGRIFADDYNQNGYLLSYGDPGNQQLRFQARSLGITLNSSLSLSLNTWYFVAIEFAQSGTTTYAFMFTFDAGGNLLDAQGTSSSSAFSAGTGSILSIGDNASGSVQGTAFAFPGNIDEVAIYDAQLTTSQIATIAQSRHPCSAFPPDHYAVSTAGTAVNCDPAPVTIKAHTSTHAVLPTTDTITLNTSTGHGDWSLTTGAGSFTAGASNSGSATYGFVAADNGNAVFALRDTYPETVTINVADGAITAKSGAALSTEDSPLVFAASGFRITNGGNVASSIATQVAGKANAQTYALQAVRTDTNTGACTSIFASGTTANVSMAYQCNNPASCIAGQTYTVTNNGTTTGIASNPSTAISSYTTVPLKFTTANAEAIIALNYSDVGQVTLAAKYNIPLGSGAGSGNLITGASQYVVQPAGFSLSNIKRSRDAFANPAAGSASGTVFIGAGQSFTSTVTAVNYLGSATPNFGQELSPATVTLTPALVLPVSGNNPSLSGNFGAFSAGAATGASFSWPEVGIITLTPATANYLGTGTVSGTASGNVGRFIPDHFSASTNIPLFGTSCTAGGFTYVGQPFTYAVAPVITATAQALGGTTTQNYTGSFLRLTNASLTGRTYTPTPASPALSLTGLPSTTVDPAITSTVAGVATLTFSAGTPGVSFVRGSAIAPFAANIALSINVIDLDGVAATNPVTFGSGSGIGFSAGANQYYGRTAIRSVLGSELLDLPMPLTNQYYVNASSGFTTNTADSCSVAPSIAFSSYQVNLGAGETCVRDTGSPGTSGAGCSTAAAAASRFYATASSGNYNLNLAAPGSGNNGAVTVTATPPAWLQYLWNSASGTNSSPSGVATFGVFPGPASRIYQKEVY